MIKRFSGPKIVSVMLLSALPLIVYIYFYLKSLAYGKQLLIVLPSCLVIGILSAFLYFLHNCRTKRLTDNKLKDLSFYLALLLMILLTFYLSAGALSEAASLRPGSALSLIVFWLMPAYLIPVLIVGYFIGWIIEVIAQGKLLLYISAIKVKKVFFVLLIGMAIFLWSFAFPLLEKFNILPMSDIHYAAQEGNILQVERFLSKGIDVNQHENTSYRDTPLHMAALCDQVEMIEFLVSQSANVNSRNAILQTPLHKAARGGCLDAVKLLIKHGAIIDAQDKNGNTPLREAVHKGNKDIVQFLLENGADVNLANNGGQTPIFQAVWYNYPKITQILLENGAHINIVDKKNRSLLWVAKNKGFHEIEKILNQTKENK